MSNSSISGFSLDANQRPLGYQKASVLPRVQRLRTKVKIMIMALLLLIATGTALCVWMQHNKLMRKTFPSRDVEAIGLRASLLTELIEGRPHYAFSAHPNSDATSKRLGDVIAIRPKNQLIFAIHLFDDAGFELCQQRIVWHPSIGEDGKAVYISGSGEITDCPKERYSQASSWRLSFNYPTLNQEIKPLVTGSSTESGIISVPTSQPAHPNKKPAVNTLIVTDSLTGADFLTGAIETLSGRSLRVRKEAEKMSIGLWRPSDSLGLSCDGVACLVTDANRNESVHAILLRD